MELRAALVVVACRVDREAAFLVEPRGGLVAAFQVGHQEHLVAASLEVLQEALVVAYPEEHPGLHEVAFQAEPYLAAHHVAECLVVDPHQAVDHVVAFLEEGPDLQVAYLVVPREILVVVRQAEVLLVDLKGDILAWSLQLHLKTSGRWLPGGPPGTAPGGAPIIDFFVRMSIIPYERMNGLTHWWSSSRRRHHARRCS